MSFWVRVETGIIGGSMWGSHVELGFRVGRQHAYPESQSNGNHGKRDRISWHPPESGFRA